MLYPLSYEGKASERTQQAIRAEPRARRAPPPEQTTGHRVPFGASAHDPDDLRTALPGRSPRPGFPSRPGGIVLECPKQREHGDWSDPGGAGAPSRSRAGNRREDRRARSRPRSRPRMSPTSSGSRSRARASSTSSSRRRGSTTCCARWWPAASRVRDGRGAGRPADQPRVRLGQPDRAAPRGRRPLGRGRRRDREPARGAGRRGAPRVLPERRRQPARHVPRRRSYARYQGRRAARGRLPGRVPRRDGRASCGPSSATTSTPEDGVRVGLPRHRRGRCRTTSGASACTSTPGSPSARCTSAARSTDVLDELDARGRRRTRTTARRWLRADRLRRPARPRARASPTADDLSLQRPRVPPRQVRPRLRRTSSTSGAPTTTGR